MNSDIIKIDTTEPGILHLILNRPEQLNALNKELLDRLSALLDQAKADTSIRAILLSGEGKHFCAGADIKQLAALNAEAGLSFARFGQSVMDKLEQLGKPSVAAVHGFALGGGCELAMAATMRVAATTAAFGQPEIKLGVIPGFGGTQRLPRLIGKGRALDFCLTGKRFTAEQAHQWGLVNELAAPENLQTHAKNILKELVKLPPTAAQAILTVIHQGSDLTLEDGLGLEAAHFAICCSTEDKREGVEAFLQKRAPVFQGA